MSVEESKHYLQIMLIDQKILLPLPQVKIILQLPYLHMVPNANEAFCGVLNYRGESIPVFSLFRLMDQADDEIINLDTPLVLCEVDSGQLGLLVSDIVDVVEIAALKMTKDLFSGIKPYITGIYYEKDFSLLLLDINQLIDHHQLTLNELNVHE